MIEEADPIKRVFSEALTLPAAERCAFLDKVCRNDSALRKQVQELLEAHEQAGHFLEEPSLLQSMRPINGISIAHIEKIGDRIGRYKLLQQIGEGGCGIVYMAEQETPVRRQVALKIIKLGMDTKSVIARFEAERQALALMDHPNIAKVFDAGATDAGRPFFVMELVRGIKITEYCDRNNLAIRERLSLFIQVCQAIEHAHQKGVIHRDIKPSNILVTLCDGVPLPLVIDFGIAKATQHRLTEKTLFTAFEQFIGTPAYMSPEQAEMSKLGVDTRSDIYSLGVLLYEMLTGQTPFAADDLWSRGLDETRRMIREVESPRPSARLSTLRKLDLTTTASQRQVEPVRLIHLVRGELDWIVMKALEKDRNRRYQTASEFARDVERYLADEPVAACPPSKSYQLQKLVRRHKLLFISASAVVIALSVGFAVTLEAMLRIRAANRQVVRARDEATENLRLSNLAEARAVRLGRKPGRRERSLEAVRKAAAIRPDTEARNEAIACLALTDLRPGRFAKLKNSDNDLVQFTSDLELYALQSAEGNITVYAETNDRAIATFPGDGEPDEFIRFSPNHRFLNVNYRHEDGSELCSVWDWRDGKKILNRLPGGSEGAFSCDSRFFFRGNQDGTLSIYDLISGAEKARFPGKQADAELVTSPGNDRVASIHETPNVEIIDIRTGAILRSITCAAPVMCASWSGDGRLLATGCTDRDVYLWDSASGRELGRMQGHSGTVTHVEFSHAGDVLASASFDNTIRLWRVGDGSEVAVCPGGSWEFAFSRDDQRLGVIQEGPQFCVENVVESECYRLLGDDREGQGNSGPEFSPDGRIVVSGTADQLHFWSAESGKLLLSLPTAGVADAVLFPATGSNVYVAERGRGLFVRSWTHTTNGTINQYVLGQPQLAYAAQNLREGTVSPDSKYLVLTEHEEGRALVFDLANLARKTSLSPHSLVDYVSLSPDDAWVATGSWQNSEVKIWNAHSGELVRTLNMTERTRPLFSPDGRWLSTSSTSYRLWKVGSWQPREVPVKPCNVPHFNCLAFNPDGSLMALVRDGFVIELLETQSGREIARLEPPEPQPIALLRFSPDGTRLAAKQTDQQVQLWDLRRLREQLKRMKLDWDLPAFSESNESGQEPIIIAEEQ